MQSENGILDDVKLEGGDTVVLLTGFSAKLLDDGGDDDSPEKMKAMN